MSATPSSTTVVRMFTRRSASPFEQGVVIVLALFLVLLLIPLVLLGAAGALLTYGVLKGKAWLDRARRPNGALDGRKNVRVRLPE